jgi:hypothetical protein
MAKMSTMKIQTFALGMLLCLLSFSVATETTSARPVVKGKGGLQTPQKFIRQRNTLSNMDFYFTNKGVLFNNDNVAGLQWPRGTNNAYIFGGGVWFATKKVIGGKRRKLCELGYNPNSGAGWFGEGEINGASDGTSPDAKYISYVGSKFNKETGEYIGSTTDATVVQPVPNWPIWDTSVTKTIKQNYYFGDYISDTKLRTTDQTINGKTPKPAMMSQEDIVNIYTDADVSNNPEYRPNSGYPFNLNIVEIIHSWSFGRYRDMIFVRHKITNASDKDTLYECFMSPAFDPDLGVGGGAAANDRNQYVGSNLEVDTVRAKRTLKGTCFESDVTRLNMAYQSSEKESGKEYGVIGFAFLQSPVTNDAGVVLDISDSLAVGGYGLQDSRRQLGLTTFKKWTISNDPPTSDLRYDFLADGSKDGDGGIVADVRLLFSTGPFTLPPNKSVETCVGIGIAQVSTTTRDLNIDSVFKLIAFAHSVFGGDCYTIYDSMDVDSVKVPTSKVVHFKTPIPPELPNMKVQSLDKAIYLTWDETADSSKDELSNKTLAFNTYELWRSTRSDLDSNFRPDGLNPNIKLGTWSIYDFKVDTIKNAQGVITGTKLTRKNTTPNKVPHSFLDIGDDNKDGVLTGNEGLINGAKYYYYLLASDEFDSVNSVGPIVTAVVKDKNLVTGIPAKPVFTDLPDDLTTLGRPCFDGFDDQHDPHVTGMNRVAIEVVDTGKFLELYANDTILVSFQPRWQEYNQRFLNNSQLVMNIDVTNSNNNIELTYDRFNNPNLTPPVNPYEFNTGLVLKVEGQNADSNVAGAFTSENNLFAPWQTVNRAFKILANYQFTQLKAPHKIQSVVATGADQKIIRFSRRTLPGVTGAPDIDYSNIPPDRVNPSFLGSLGEVEYEIRFGPAEDMNVQKWDTTTKSYVTVTNVVDQGSGTVFTPRPLRVTVVSKTHCDSVLSTVRDANTNDYTPEMDYRYYSVIAEPNPSQPGLYFPAYSDPDSLLVPNPGFFSIDAFHYSDDDPANHAAANLIDKTSGHYYYSGITQSGSKYMPTVHRIRLGGAEIILNYPAISDPSNTGDTTVDDAQFAEDFQEGDVIRVKFTGIARGLPFPGAEFKIPTSPLVPVDYNNSSLYATKEILDQVTVVPNPFVVTHIGQTTTDNSKLFFTRLPPRATIEIYTPDGDLVKTIEHYGYEGTANTSNGDVDYDPNTLKNRYNVAEWNILSEGRQRVGSQVLIARVIAKDLKNGDSVIGETTVKFAVILGGYRQVD